MYKLFLVILILGGCSYHKSDGQRSGIITKISRKGILCKTYEGQMSIGYTKNGVGTVSKEDFNFTVINGGILDKVKKYNENNTPVKITYHQELFCLCDSDSCFFVDDIEEIK